MRALRYVASAFLLIAPAAAMGQQTAALGKPTVAVMHITAFSPGQDAASLREAVEGMFASEFGNKPSIQLLERQQIKDLVDRQKLMVSGRMSEEDAMRAGKMSGAMYILLGSVVFDSKNVRIDIRLIDTETALPAKPPFRKTGPKDELLTLVQQVADEFTKDLKLVNRAVVVATTQPVPVGAALAYSRGLDYEKRGKKQLAAEQYQKALELSPSHAEAKAALDRVR